MGKNNPTYVQDMIIEFIGAKGYCTYAEIVEELSKKNSRGFSQKTISKHLSRLVEFKQVERLVYPEYVEKYEIFKPDKKPIYLLTSKAPKADYFSEITKALLSNDPTKKKNALREVSLRKDVYLLPGELLKFSEALTSEDIDICAKVAKIIEEHIKKQIIPSDPKKFKERLIACYEKHQENDQFSNYLRSPLLFMMGIFDIENVIEYFKYDTNPSKTKPINLMNYNHWSLAGIFNKHKADVARFLLTLPEKESEGGFNVIYNIEQQLDGYNKRINEFRKQIKLIEEQKR